LSTIRGPDRVIVLDGGRIVEEGSIAELIGSGGLFSRLWEAQTGRDPHTRSGSDGRSTLGVTDRARTASAPAGHPP
jgi:hypothetical protein